MASFSLSSSKYAPNNSAAGDADDDFSQINFSLKAVDLKHALPEQTSTTQDVNIPEDAELQDSKFEVILKLADLQGDPNSPLYSIKKFEELGL